MATATLFHLMELIQLQSIPKWGLRVCNYCGCSSSNGAYACKSCNKLFQQIHETKVTKRAACDVSELLVPHDVPKPTRYEQGSVAQTKGPGVSRQRRLVEVPLSFLQDSPGEQNEVCDMLGDAVQWRM